jgi:hypothetical protein
MVKPGRAMIAFISIRFEPVKTHKIFSNSPLEGLALDQLRKSTSNRFPLYFIAEY